MTNPDGSLTPRSDTILAHTPFGRFGEPEEILGTLQWLASDASKFVSSTLTVIDGGFDAFSIQLRSKTGNACPMACCAGLYAT